MTDMPKMEMLPCPWCGKCLHKGLGFWCHLDRMCVGSDIVVTDTPEAIAAWNRRPAQPASPSAWLPISSAPKDGWILLSMWGDADTGPAHCIVAQYDGESPAHPWATMDGLGYAAEAPTHWQPLPSPPGEVEQEQATRGEDAATAPTDRL